VTEYRQDVFAHSVKAGQEWVDLVPVTFFSNSDFDQIGIMALKDSGALCCDAPNGDYKVRAIVDLPISGETSTIERKSGSHMSPQPVRK